MRTLSKKGKILLAVIIVVSVVALVFGVREYTGEKEPIEIGLSNTLTGMASSAGAQSRNGVMLAVEEANSKGGVNGRPIKLLIRDDKGDPREAVRVDLELIDLGVVAILGHFLSTPALAAVPLMNEKDILMIGLSTTTPKLTGLDDNFIRLNMPADKKAPLVADFVYNSLNLRKMVVVYDLSNRKYSEPFFRNFKKAFEKPGGVIIAAIPFDPREKYSAPDIAKQISDSDAEGLFLIANGIHGALICQHLRKSGSKINIIDAGWGFSDPAFIGNGGAAIDGVLSLDIFNMELPGESFRNFTANYESRFGQKVDLRAQLGYEAARILLAGLSKTDNPKKLKEAILEQKVFTVLGADIVLDEYGDPIRSMYLQEIRNGKIETIEKIRFQK